MGSRLYGYQFILIPKYLANQQENPTKQSFTDPEVLANPYDQKKKNGARYVF